MKLKYDITKRSVILLWCLSISAFLYYYMASMQTEIGLPQFLNFTIILWGGSFAYHVTTKLIDCPQTSLNNKVWNNLFLHLIKISFGYVIVGISIYFAKLFGGNWGWLLALVGLIAGGFWVLYYFLSLEKPIKQLLSTTELS